MDTLTVAREFFNACDFGKGWDGCKQFCHPNASFETEPMPMKTDYVYALHFEDGKIHHVSKIWEFNI